MDQINQQVILKELHEMKEKLDDVHGKIRLFYAFLFVVALTNFVIQAMKSFGL